MDSSMEKKNSVSELMRSTMEKIHEMVDTNAIVGQDRSGGLPGHQGWCHSGFAGGGAAGHCGGSRH